MKIFTSLLVFLALIFPAATPCLYAEKAPEATEIVILHANDMHAKIDNMGKLAALAQSMRKTHKYVFLVSAGDRIGMFANKQKGGRDERFYNRNAPAPLA